MFLSRYDIFANRKGLDDITGRRGVQEIDSRHGVPLKSYTSVGMSARQDYHHAATVGGHSKTARPVRPPPSSRRNMFGAPSSRRALANLDSSDARLQAEKPEASNDYVERDASGNYIIAAPSTGMKSGAALRTQADEETEQEDQLISLYDKHDGPWDQNWDQKALLEEIKIALDSSMARMVQSLENDCWIFEGEPAPEE